MSIWLFRAGKNGEYEEMFIIAAALHTKSCFAQECCPLFHCLERNCIYRLIIFFESYL